MIKNKIIIVLGIFLLGILAFYVLHLPVKQFENVILIGWDGAQRDDLYKLLQDGKLPNLNKIIKQGKIVNTDIISGKTETKPGWAEILTGYTSESLGIRNNLYYKPIPKGYTIFERLRNYFGKDNISTVFIAGKPENLGARGPHLVCTNCFARDPATYQKTNWSGLTGRNDAQTYDGSPKIFENRQGEPYFYTKEEVNFYISGLKQALNVGKKALEELERLKNNRFFMFFHFEEPDEPGHIYGENSPEYLQGIETDDFWLGQIIAKLESLNLYDRTIIYVTADHGFDKDKRSHSFAPDTWLATNDKGKYTRGTRLDITPTILDRLGLNLKEINPPLAGKSLLNSK